MKNSPVLAIIFFNKRVAKNDRDRVSFQILYILPNTNMLLSREIGFFLGSYDSRSSHISTIKLYAAIDTCQTISLV